MSLHKKKKFKRWSIRILLIIILLPLLTLMTIRYAGWMRMRKTDREIKAFLGPYHVHDQIDTVIVSGRKIVCLKTSLGDKKEDALILVHGSPGSLDAYLEYMADPNLLSRADLITYDRPGFGNSAFGQSLPSLSGQADILRGLMQVYDYNHYWLAGHSYGGPVILEAAIRYPDDIAGICLISGSISPEQEPKSAAWRKWIDLPLLRDILPVSMRVSNEELMPLRQDLRILEDDWDRIRMPVSLIHGTKDVLVPFENLHYAKEKLVNADTVYTRIFEGENHFIPWTRKKDIVDELVRLIDTGKD